MHDISGVEVLDRARNVLAAKAKSRLALAVLLHKLMVPDPDGAKWASTQLSPTQMSTQ